MNIVLIEITARKRTTILMKIKSCFHSLTPPQTGIVGNKFNALPFKFRNFILNEKLEHRFDILTLLAFVFHTSLTFCNVWFKNFKQFCNTCTQILKFISV